MTESKSFNIYFVPFLVSIVLFMFGFFHMPEFGICLANVYLISILAVGLILFSRIKKRYANVEKIVAAYNTGRLYLLTVVLFTLFLNGLGFILWRTDPLWYNLPFIKDESNFVFVIVMTLILFLLSLYGLSVSYKSYKSLNNV